jgi:c-di-GMP-binding flagellar brake protein YcgR
MLQHKRSSRHHIEFRVIFDDGESYSAALVEDISDTGMFLHGPDKIPIGSILRFEPADPEEDALFEAAAKVVRCESLDERADGEAHFGLWGVAVEFVAMTEKERAGVMKMVAHLESDQRARSASGIRDPLTGELVLN